MPPVVTGRDKNRAAMPRVVCVARTCAPPKPPPVLSGRPKSGRNNHLRTKNKGRKSAASLPYGLGCWRQLLPRNDTPQRQPPARPEARAAHAQCCARGVPRTPGQLVAQAEAGPGGTRSHLGLRSRASKIATSKSKRMRSALAAGQRMDAAVVTAEPVRVADRGGPHGSGLPPRRAPATRASGVAGGRQGGGAPPRASSGDGTKAFK